MQGVINGWKYYHNANGQMVACYPNVEQIVFDNDKAFKKWLEAEKDESN